MDPTETTIVYLILLVMLAVGIISIGFALSQHCMRCGRPLRYQDCEPVVGDDFDQIFSLWSTGTHLQQEDQ